MTENIKLKLLEDTHSNIKKTMYGKKGDVVNLVAKRGIVLIVEDKLGYRFPINENKVEIVKYQK